MAKSSDSEIWDDFIAAHAVVHIYRVLVEIVATDRCSRCLPSRLNCREQQSCQERHYCGRDKKLNERKSAAPHNPPHRNLGAKGAF
jgi:hypothetical protein